MRERNYPVACMAVLGFLVLICAVSALLAVPTAKVLTEFKLDIGFSSYWVAFAVWFVVLSIVAWIGMNIAWKNVHKEYEEGLKR